MGNLIVVDTCTLVTGYEGETLMSERSVGT